MHRGGRIPGIREQFERAKLFLMEARKSTDRLDRFRRIVASIYFARATVELMLEAADKQEVNISKDEMGKNLKSRLPRYNLIYRLRLHDFHRFCLMERPGLHLQGGVRLTANKGGVAVELTSEGPKITTTGDSQFDEGRSVIISGDKVFDDESGHFIPIGLTQLD